MKNKLVILFFLTLHFSLFSQIKGKVVDENNNPIPFVNITFENENGGTSSEENGAFVLNSNDKHKILVFSALGFETKKIAVSQTAIVVLKKADFQLDEIVLLNKHNTKEREIGVTENLIFQANENGPRIDAKFFPYFAKYKKTKFIKKFSIQTDSKIDDALLKIHFYSVDKEGFPSIELLKKEYIVSINKGTKYITFNISNFNLTMPKNGIFVGFEKLYVEKNKSEKTTTDFNTNTTKTQTTYYPFVLYNYVERDVVFAFANGKWNKKTKNDLGDLSKKMMIYEPVINLTLSN
jgi:hypothetical protein